MLFVDWRCMRGLVERIEDGGGPFNRPPVLGANRILERPRGRVGLGSLRGGSVRGLLMAVLG